MVRSSDGRREILIGRSRGAAFCAAAANISDPFVIALATAPGGYNETF